MDLHSSMSETFGGGVWISDWVEFQADDTWDLQDWIWDRTEFQKEYYTWGMYNLAIF